MLVRVSKEHDLEEPSPGNQEDVPDDNKEDDEIDDHFVDDDQDDDVDDDDDDATADDNDDDGIICARRASALPYHVLEVVFLFEHGERDLTRCSAAFISCESHFDITIQTCPYQHTVSV